MKLESNSSKLLDFYTRISVKTSRTAEMRQLVDYVISETTRLLNADSGSIMVFDPDAGSLRLFLSTHHPAARKVMSDREVGIPIEEGVSAMVFRSGKPILVTDASQPEGKISLRNKSKGSFISVPLKVTRQVVGVLNLNRDSRSKPFSKSGLKLASQVQTMLAGLIERARVLEILKQSEAAAAQTTWRNQILLEISKDLASSLDPHTVLKKAFEQFEKVIGYASVSALMFDDFEKTYRIIIQPSVTISKRFQERVTERMLSLFSEFPIEPELGDHSEIPVEVFPPIKKTSKELRKYTHDLHLPIIISEEVVGMIHLAKAGSEPYTASDLTATSQFTGIFVTSIRNALIHKRTEQLAFTDPLTGLYNHRYFQETLQQEFLRAKRYEKPLSLMVIDLDHFKNFNDTYGHLIGDKVLVHVGKLFIRSVRDKIDTVARYGGEEFVVVLPETPLDGAEVFAERIRRAVESEPLLHEDQRLKITLSIGVACTASTVCDKASSLIQAADNALYTAKEEGRNRVRVYNKKTI